MAYIQPTRKTFLDQRTVQRKPGRAYNIFAAAIFVLAVCLAVYGAWEPSR